MFDIHFAPSSREPLAFNGIDFNRRLDQEKLRIKATIIMRRIELDSGFKTTARRYIITSAGSPLVDAFQADRIFNEDHVLKFDFKPLMPVYKATIEFDEYGSFRGTPLFANTLKSEGAYTGKVDLKTVFPQNYYPQP